MALINTNTATFNGVDLTTVSGLTILATNPYDPASRKLTISDLARTNKAKINSGFYTRKPITVKVGITRATRDLVESSLDSLMSIVQGIEKDLVLRQSGGTRKYTCALSDVALRVDGGAYMEMDLVFETSDHFGYDNATTLLTQISGYTSSTKTTQITIGGSAAWQVPVITITYTALTLGTGTYLSVGNDATGQTLLITRTFANGDVVEVDSRGQTVKVNAAEVAFTGAIPEWAPGTGYITVVDNFSARTYSMRMDYVRRWV